MSADRKRSRIRRLWIGFRIGTIGVWLLATVPILALCELIADLIFRVDLWLGKEDPEILGDLQERDPANSE